MPFPWARVASLATALLLLSATVLLYNRASYREFVRYVTRGMVERAGIVMFSRNGRVTSVNRRASELLLLPRDMKTGMLNGLLAQPSFAALRVEFAKVKDGKLSRAVADVVLDVDGVARTFRAALSRLRLGGYLLSLEDLAAVEYARRVAAWGPVAQRLAHGIKTPLSTIRLTAQTMEDKDPDGAKVIEEEVDRLAKMTDGFVRLADFEPLRLEAKDINTVVRRVLGELGVASLHGIELKLDLAERLPAVQLDEEQVVRALGNLVSNAIQAMQGKGRLAVSTRRTDAAAEVVVTVADSGPGIPSEYQAKLFQPFFTHGKADGSGLGLTIVRKVAEDHGGRVEVESEPGKGAEFRLVLPVRTAPS
jgi:two-component system nitrogen regulation sensor histidine kinase NtrY